MTAPSEFPPPVDPAEEFIGPPTDPEDERIEVGVAIVGGGQAGLACAIRLLQLLDDDPELTEKLGEVPVAVLEKGKVAGAHQLSGAVMNPSAIRELLPDDDSWPTYGEVDGESVYFMLNRKRALPLKPVPPPFRNHGNHVVALAELNRWLAEKAEELGAYILTETVGQKLLVEDGVVRGVRTGDKGRDKEGGQKANFEPGSDVVARATVLADGCWGHLTGAALKSLGLAPKDPQVWALGVKEVWEVSKPLEKVIHTLGWPLRPGARWKEFGGSWIYGMNREGETPKVSIGFVVGLDHTDARLSVHDVLQEFKLHPLVQEDPRRRQARRLGREGDPRGRLLGAAEAARARHGDLRRRRRHGQRAAAQGHPLRDPLGHARRRDDLPAAQGRPRPTSRPTTTAVHDSEIGKDLWESRNMKQPFGKGLIIGGAVTNAMVVTKGRFPGGHWPTHRDAESDLTLRLQAARELPEARRQADVRQAVRRLPHRQRDARRRAEPHPDRQAGAARGRRGVGVDVPRRRLRGARRRARGGHGRPDREPVELRAVRRDHGQGRAPDAARGRRRAAVPGDVGARPRNSAAARALWEAHAPHGRTDHRAARARRPAGRPGRGRQRAAGRVRPHRPGRRVRGPDAERERRHRAADALHAAGPPRRQAGVPARRRVRLRRLDVGRPRHDPVRLHPPRRAADRPGPLPRRRALPLAGAGRAHPGPRPRDLALLHAARHAARTCASSA